jgi:O-antigen/teichoic acid export membrane protein
VSPTLAYARLRRTVRPHADLLTSSTSLIATSAVTSAFGVVFWWLAAHSASPTAVGQAGAAVSAMTFLGTIGMAGLGTLLISELPAMTGSMTGHRWRLIAACVLVAATIGLVGGLLYVAAAWLLMPWLAAPLTVTVLLIGIVVTASTLVLDEGLIGLLAGGVQLIRNAYFSGGKLLLLAAFALAPLAVTATDIVGAWVAAAALSLIAVAVSVRARGLSGSVRPDFGRLRVMRRRAMDHNLLNLALYLPRLVLPLVVTLVVSAQANAGFYTAWMIVTVLAMIPAHFATALFALARDPDLLRAKLKVALLVSLGVGVPLSLVVIAERDRIMSVFGAGYVALGGAALGILATTYVPTVVRQLYIAVSRVTGRLRRATAVALAAGAVEIGASVLGAVAGGVTGLAVALAIVCLAEGAVMAPAVVKALRPPR